MQDFLVLKASTPKIEGDTENLKKLVELPLLDQTYPCMPKKAPTKSGATVPLIAKLHDWAICIRCLSGQGVALSL